MAEIQIQCEHALGLPQARKMAFTWAGQAENLLDAFKEKIEGEIVKNLDALLAKKPTVKSHASKDSAGKKPAAKKKPAGR